MLNTLEYKALFMNFVKRVSEVSSLTECQMKSLLLYRRVLSGELSLAQASKLREPKSSTVGAFYRVVQQGKGNVRQAIMTLIAGIWLGYVKPEDLRRLFDLVADNPFPLDQERFDQLLPALEALIGRMVD